MPKLTRSDLCFRSALLLALVGVAIVFSVALEQATNDSADSEYWIFLGHRLKITDFLLVIFNGLLFAATAGLFFATLALWRATRDLVTGAEETAKYQLRAYLSYDHRGFGLFRTERVNFYVIKADYTLKNLGQTTAKDVSVVLGFYLLPYPQSVDAVISSPNENPESFRPYVQPQKELLQSSMATVEIDLAKVQRENLRFYIYGIATYKDVFDRVWWTALCGYINETTDWVQAAKKGVGTFQVNFTRTKQHNRAT